MMDRATSLSLLDLTHCLAAKCAHMDWFGEAKSTAVLPKISGMSTRALYFMSSITTYATWSEKMELREVKLCYLSVTLENSTVQCGIPGPQVLSVNIGTVLEQNMSGVNVAPEGCDSEG